MKDLSISARYVKGVGPSKLGLLNRLGIETVGDLLYCVPRRHEDRSRICRVSEVRPGNLETIKVKVLAFGDRTTKRGMNIFQLAVGDSTGVMHATWFNQPYMKDKFKVGHELVLHGKVEKHIYLQINNPEYEILEDTKDDSAHIGRIVPIYPLTEDITQRWFRNVMKFTVDNYVDAAQDMLPYDIKRRNDLMPLKQALRNAHFPVSEVVLKKAMRRLIFDEFLLLQAGIALKRATIKIDLTGYSHNLKGDLVERFKKLLPFEFTNSQKKVIKEIQEDMQSLKPMNRLLQGDVGSGKTIVALYALILAIQGGYQGALMVPTEILADQHYKNVTNLLKELNIKIALLSGDLKPKERDRRKHMIEVGEADLVIGTHALIQQGMRFKKLGLAVIDEQHKFGVAQRALLKSKSQNPDVLVMTATPIPRTLAMTVYGDLDISVIDELPPGRKEIKTLYFQEKNREKAYKIAGEQVALGRQAYVVYPVIEESQRSDLRGAVKMRDELSEFFPDLKVGLLHGRMKSKEKEKIMLDFKEKRIDILVSTIVIEVGVDIPNSSTMIVEHAERFGLSQLHQLRGRIGRGSHISYCILVSDPKNDEAKSRIKAMLKTQDGFKIAEEDLEIRGPGEFFGTRQHGLPELKIGNIVRDRGIMELARAEATELIKKDRFLRRPENRLIRENLKKKFSMEKLELAATG
ncbi:MAG: ATP-dependent DNA helicase RecG [Candidatus Omnitrophica bacterium]|nr:ATP-dependent DNA helicase RecG [Candidatus Omnitrophota bacterium]